MTVCIAALSAKGACIICLADKALSYGDVSWDSDSAKIIPLGKNEAVALTAGSDRYITRLLGKITEFSGYTEPVITVIKFLEEKFQECVREIQDIEILLPRMLTREQYLSAISGTGVNEHIKGIDRDLRSFQFDCELIICGFVKKSLPYILLLEPPGLVTDCTNNGFCAIGSGAEKALSRLLFVDHKREHGVAHVLYDCFDAKANAEMNFFVGYDWDAYLLSGGRVKTVPQKAKPLLDRVWAKRNRSPFTKTRDPDDLPPPPRNWEMQLRQIVAETLGSAFDETGQLREYPVR
jgi:hypothetical protein